MLGQCVERIDLTTDAIFVLVVWLWACSVESTQFFTLRIFLGTYTGFVNQFVVGGLSLQFGRGGVCTMNWK